jgi:hypothetical protein
MQNLDDYDKYMINEMRKKQLLHFEKDFYSMTMLCLLNENIERYRLTERKLS